MAFLPLVFLVKYSDLEKKLLVLVIFLFSIAFFSILNMSNRTGLLILLVSLLGFIYIQKEKRFRSIMIFIIFFSILLIFYLKDIWGFSSWFKNSLLFDRLSNTGINEESSRIDIWKNALFDLIDYPFGYRGNVYYSLMGSDYAHNLWLDVGLKTGFMPLIPLFIFTISGIVDLVKTVFYSKYDIFLRVLIFAFGIGFYITFFMEPVLEGLFIMFFIYCFFSGILNEVRRRTEINPDIQKYEL